MVPVVMHMLWMKYEPTPTDFQKENAVGRAAPAPAPPAPSPTLPETQTCSIGNEKPAMGLRQASVPLLLPLQLATTSGASHASWPIVSASARTLISGVVPLYPRPLSPPHSTRPSSVVPLPRAQVSSTTALSRSASQHAVGPARSSRLRGSASARELTTDPGITLVYLSSCGFFFCVMYHTM